MLLFEHSIVASLWIVDLSVQSESHSGLPLSDMQCFYDPETVLIELRSDQISCR